MTIRESTVDLDLSMVPEFGAKELFFRLNNFIGENLSLVFVENEIVQYGKVTSTGYIDPGVFLYTPKSGHRIVSAIGRFELQGPPPIIPVVPPPGIFPDTQLGAIPYQLPEDYDHKVRTRVGDNFFLFMNYNTDIARIAAINAIIFQVKATR